MPIDPPNPELVAGYGLFGALAWLAANVLRRTKEIDHRRDALAEDEIAMARLVASRNDAEIDRLRHEVADLRAQLEEANRERHPRR